MRATQLKIQASSACWTTRLWLKTMLLLRVDAGGQEGGGDLARRLDQLGRILPGGDRVLVDDAIDAVVAGLQLRKAADGAEIVAEMQIAGRLDARKDERLEGGH